MAAAPAAAPFKKPRRSTRGFLEFAISKPAFLPAVSESIHPCAGERFDYHRYLSAAAPSIRVRGSGVVPGFIADRDDVVSGYDIPDHALPATVGGAYFKAGKRGRGFAKSSTSGPIPLVLDELKKYGIQAHVTLTDGAVRFARSADDVCAVPSFPS